MLAVFFEMFIHDANVCFIFAVAGMAAVTGCVIGGPISTMMIIFELTSDYQVALGAGISICFANLISSKIYEITVKNNLAMNKIIKDKIVFFSTKSDWYCFRP